MSKKVAVKTWLERIRCAYAHNETTVVESLIISASEATGNAPEVREVAGMLAFDRGDCDEAIKLIESAMFEIPLSVTGQMALADAFLKTGNRNRAESIYQFLVQIIDRVPCGVMPHFIKVLTELGCYQGAVTACRESCKRHPNDDSAIFNAAFCLHRAGYPLPQVHKAMLRAVELKPNCSLYRINIAVVCGWLDRWDEAYSHACAISAAALNDLPCQCMVSQLQKIFAMHDDDRSVRAHQSN